MTLRFRPRLRLGATWRGRPRAGCRVPGGRWQVGELRQMDTAIAQFSYAQAGSGPPVLLLPGSGGWRLTFSLMVAELAQRHTVYAHLVTAPVLLLWRTADRFLPVRLVDRFIARLPDVEPHVLAGCGHSLRDDCPERTYELLLPFLTPAGS